ncbi:hypothetical protein Pint_15525 [Pistacia integerrima]|uniref:Uncharacterized protein n=1 Tax=Pistacia integerrima TaxID=434235 RepID=A0ACC0ZER8_9ROSI|nr:hypothetical protein Pint_15525 [Pistacia integerrima]
MTLALDVPKIGTIGLSEFNNSRLLAFQPCFSFWDLSERESNTASWSWFVSAVSKLVRSTLFTSFRSTQL